MEAAGQGKARTQEGEAEAVVEVAEGEVREVAVEVVVVAVAGKEVVGQSAEAASATLVSRVPLRLQTVAALREGPSLRL